MSYTDHTRRVYTRIQSLVNAVVFYDAGEIRVLQGTDPDNKRLKDKGAIVVGYYNRHCTEDFIREDLAWLDKEFKNAAEECVAG